MLSLLQVKIPLMHTISAPFSAKKDEADYHFKLSLLYSSPKQIFWYWDIGLLNKNILALVGPRQCSPYARQVMEALFKTLPAYDCVTISWLAPGVDMMCHEMSIASSIPTIAILGGWLEYFMKSGSREIINSIVDHGGLVLSEFDLDKKPEKYTFPQRNRIVAGLAECVFLPEAGQKSGSLITADFARQMHKPVYGAPSSMFSLSSQGLHQYMQEWLITPVSDFGWMLGKYFGKKVEELRTQGVEKWSLFDIGGQEDNKVLEILQKRSDWLTMNELVRESGLWVDEVMSELGILEVMGRVRLEPRSADGARVYKVCKVL